MPNHIVIGSDPEFSVANAAGECVPADRLFSDGNGQLGFDGRSDTGELRPPAGSVSKHVMEIRRLVNRFATEHPEHKMLAGSRHFRQPLGGHIHFSGNPIREPEKIVRCLDIHLAVPLLMLENRVSARERRRSHEYGMLTSWRNQRDLHGGIEYRTPSSWLVSMNITKMTLDIATLIAYDYKKLLDKHGMPFINPSDGNLNRRYKNADKTSLFDYNGKLTNLHKIAIKAVVKLKKLPNAPQVMNSILTLENALRLRTRWFHEIDATTRWHLPATTLKLKEIEWKRIVFEPTSIPIFGNPNDFSCLSLTAKVKELLGEVGLNDTYYIYGILNRHNYDFAVSRHFRHYDARVDYYTMHEGVIGEAGRNLPSPDAVAIGVSRANRDDERQLDTAAAIVRMIKTMERL